MIEKTVIEDGKEITFKLSAATPRLYRAKFQQDLLLAMTNPQDLEIVENLAWVAAGCPDKSVEKWLEKFSPKFALELSEIILEMWAENIATVEGEETANEGEGKNVMTEES